MFRYRESAVQILVMTSTNMGRRSSILLLNSRQHVLPDSRLGGPLLLAKLLCRLLLPLLTKAEILVKVNLGHGHNVGVYYAGELAIFLSPPASTIFPASP